MNHFFPPGVHKYGHTQSETCPCHPKLVRELDGEGVIISEAYYHFNFPLPPIPEENTRRTKIDETYGCVDLCDRLNLKIRAFKYGRSEMIQKKRGKK